MSKYMKLPELENTEKYVGLYVFDFGDHSGVGFTAEEVAELFDSEKYQDCKAYKIHRLIPGNGSVRVPSRSSRIFSGTCLDSHLYSLIRSIIHHPARVEYYLVHNNPARVCHILCSIRPSLWQDRIDP